MNDESTNRRVSSEEREDEKELSTADLAGAGHDAPKTDLSEPRIRADEARARDRGMPPSSESRTAASSERTDDIRDNLSPSDAGFATDVGSNNRVSTSPEIGNRPQSGGNISRAAAPAPAMAQETGPLFTGSEANELRSRWDAIQVGFVDEPRRSVEQADNLVAGTMKRLAEIFADERNKLEHAWDQGENVSTEDLRQALRRYRSFFGRLLSV